ncbi:hypothetical protein [Actinomadura sp. NEAU-AAG7]|uniref:hypothetical protein n=1 Tax=Actinomadura sp. NEAU-AAG7 TaxID=2839640 RepID=UPI001BE4467F|nr:hypothetical protein [Actinomadura sp. NEAU-AAG7]MBT2213494.1 hypothetical protein [Actinomadura sp. NEAU-AAG7]
MKISVKLTVELTAEDVESLNTEYGCGTSAQEIRDFVKSYILNDAQQCPAGDFWTARLA